MAPHNLFSGFLLGTPALAAWFLAGNLEYQLLDTVVLLSVELEKLILVLCHCNLGVLLVKHEAQLLALDLLQHLPYAGLCVLVSEL